MTGEERAKITAERENQRKEAYQRHISEVVTKVIRLFAPDGTPYDPIEITATRREIVEYLKELREEHQGEVEYRIEEPPKKG